MHNSIFHASGITISNFKNFIHEEINFKSGVNLIVGENGYGKTGLLDAIASSIGGSPFTSYTKKTREYNKIDFKLRRIHKSEVGYDPEGLNWPVTLSLNLKRGSDEIELLRSRDGISSYYAENSVSDMFGGYSPTKVLEDKSIELPVFAYYGTGRLHLKRFSRDGKSKRMFFGNRLTAYDGCMEPSSNEQFLKDWLNPANLRYLNRSQSKMHFEALMDMLEICIPGNPKLSFDKNEERILFHFKNGDQALPYEYLSDGQKATVSMFADLGLRCLILNSGVFGETSINNTSGIVLIDEIDLHLHPIWQREIISNLKKAFPLIQFIITTHSPFIIQSLELGELVTWGDEELRGNYVNQSLEDIAENVQHVENPQWSFKRLEMFKTAKEIFGQMKNASDLDQIKRMSKRDEFLKLIKPFNDDVAYCAFIEINLIQNGFGNIESN